MAIPQDMARARRSRVSNLFSQGTGRWQRRTARDFRCYFPALPWCLRQERGEMTGRRHCHFLLTGLPAHAVSVKTCMTLKIRWEQLGGGFARVSEFNPALN